jgi:hypothetical protein
MRLFGQFQKGNSQKFLYGGLCEVDMHPTSRRSVSRSEPRSVDPATVPSSHSQWGKGGD